MSLAVKNFLRVLAIFALLFCLYLTYSLTFGLDRQAIPINNAGQVQVDSAAWAVRFFDYFMPILSISDLDAAVNYFVFFTSVALAVSTAIVGVIFGRSYDVKEAELKSLFPVTTVPIETVGVEDISTMTKYYKGADFVTVFSGDFSWLSNDDDISAEVDRLAKDGKIRFHSSRSRSEVSAAVGQEKLERYLPLFQFSSPSGFKASLVQMQGGAQYLLYNRREAGSKSEVIIFENKRSLSEPISRLGSFIRQLKSPPFVVFVCGETGSGKTKVARQIQLAANAQLISVGDFFRNLTEAAGANHADRNTVIGVGKQYLDKFGPIDLAKTIIGNFDPTKDTIVVDGLRPPEALDYVRTRFQNYVIIYVEAPFRLRVERCSKFDLNNMDQSIDALGRPVASLHSVIKIDNNHRNIEQLNSEVKLRVLDRFSYLQRQ